MGPQSFASSSTASYRSIKASASYHLSSTFIILAWGVIVVATVVVNELAAIGIWEPRSGPTGDIPWAFSGTGLPSILRTAFIQAHGPITSMHLARLAVGALDGSWSSPKTWMELFWLADRRWAGPFGLGKTFWAIISRRLGVSFVFLLLAALNVVALVTPVVMTRTYTEKSRDFPKKASLDVLVLNLSAVTIEELAVAQFESADSMWSKGVSAKDLLPRNIYRDFSSQSIDGGAVFLSGELHGAQLTLPGILVEGGCAAWRTYDGPTAFVDRCMEEFGAQLNPDSVVTREVAYADSGRVTYSLITNASSCSNIESTTPFGRDTPSSVLFRMWIESNGVSSAEATMIRCNVTAGLGTALVRNFGNPRFANFSYSPPNFSAPIYSTSSKPLDPIAAIIQSDLLAFQRSISVKSTSTTAIDPSTSMDVWMAAAMWDGIFATAAELWLRASKPVELECDQWVTGHGIYSDSTARSALVALLSIWFIGMFAATTAFLRPTWTGTLDGYAAARMLQYQPIISGTPEVWFADLEENSEMLERFRMHKWRSLHA